jgi:hypothetical protein
MSTERVDDRPELLGVEETVGIPTLGERNKRRSDNGVKVRIGPRHRRCRYGEHPVPLREPVGTTAHDLSYALVSGKTRWSRKLPEVIPVVHDVDIASTDRGTM